MSNPFAGGLGASRDPDEIERQLDQWAAGFAAKAERYRAAQERTEQLRLSATSPDGSVRVTVRADGSVTDLAFTEKIRSMPLPEISALILGTMRRAQGNIANQVSAVMTEQLGDEDAETRAVTLDNLRERFPELPDEPGTAADEIPEEWEHGDDPSSAAPEPPRNTPPASTTPTPPPSTPGQHRPGPDDDADEDFDPFRD
jgi:DNA-binding protein YbaB